MKKIIKGKTCNTDTAELIGYYPIGGKTTLYRRKKDNFYFMEMDGVLHYITEGSAEALRKSKNFVIFK